MEGKRALKRGRKKKGGGGDDDRNILNTASGTDLDVGLGIGANVVGENREGSTLEGLGDLEVDGGGAVAGVLLGDGLGVGSEVPGRLRLLVRLLLRLLLIALRVLRTLFVAGGFEHEARRHGDQRGRRSSELRKERPERRDGSLKVEEEVEAC